MHIPIEDICRMVAVQLGLRNVAPGDDLIRDLGAESADVMNLVANLEDRYGIEIAEDELADLRTAADFHRRIQPTS